MLLLTLNRRFHCADSIWFHKYCTNPFRTARFVWSRALRSTDSWAWERGRCYSPGVGSGICQMCVYLFCSMQLAARRYAGPVAADVADCRSLPLRVGGPSVLGPATAAPASFPGPSSVLQQQQHSLHCEVVAAAAVISLSWKLSPWRPVGDGRGGSGATWTGGLLALLLLLAPSPWQPLLGRRYISSSTSLTRLFGEIGCGSGASSVDVDDLLCQQRLLVNNTTCILI